MSGRSEQEGGAGSTGLASDGIQGDQQETQDDVRVPVHVASRSADRLLEAEEELEQMRARISELEAELEEAQLMATAASRTQAIESAAWNAGASDVETVALLAAVAIDSGAAADAADAVTQLASSKPHLFAMGALPRVEPVMGVASMDHPGAEPPALVAAREASATGDRSALLRYLRLRRSAI